MPLNLQTEWIHPTFRGPDNVTLIPGGDPQTAADPPPANAFTFIGALPVNVISRVSGSTRTVLRGRTVYYFRL